MAILIYNRTFTKMAGIESIELTGCHSHEAPRHFSPFFLGEKVRDEASSLTNQSHSQGEFLK
jgi:hypothetical protein